MSDLSGDDRFADHSTRLFSLMETMHVDMNDPHPLLVDSLSSQIFDPSSFERSPDRHQPQWVIDKYFKR